MTHRDLDCAQELDPFAREVDPFTALEQWLLHLLATERGQLALDPGFGIGLAAYLSKSTVPASLSAEIEAAALADDRLYSARATVERPAPELIRVTLQVECESGWRTAVFEADRAAGVRKV